MCVSECVFCRMHAEARARLCRLPLYSLPCCLETGLSLNLKLTILTRLTGLWALVLTSVSQGWVYKHVQSCQLLIWVLGIWTQVLRLAEQVLLLLPEPPSYSCLFSFAKHFLLLKSNCSFKSHCHAFNLLYKKQVVALSVWVVKVPWEPLWLLKSGCFGFKSRFSLCWS